MTDPLIIGNGDHRYEWNSDWAQVPDDVQLGYTHGVAVTKDGRVHVFNQSKHAVLSFNPDGSFHGMWDEFPSDRFLRAHGLTLIEEGGDEYFWLTDQTSGEVVKTTLDGRTVLAIDKPGDYPTDAKYSPTWAAQSPVDGTIFVADGYGSSRVNRYARDGDYIDHWDGGKGLGAFRCPHCVWIGKRPQATGRDEPVVYITDRGNHRVQIFDLAGGFINAFYQDHPCCIDQGPGGELLVPDLFAFVNVYDDRDRPIATKLGDHQHDIVRHDGWPNVPAEKIEPGKFNSPHGGCFDAEGNIYIVEWIETGRITKLTRQ